MFPWERNPLIYIPMLKGSWTWEPLKKPKYKPFYKIALGRPALGTYGTKFHYTENVALGL